MTTPNSPARYSSSIINLPLRKNGLPLLLGSPPRTLTSRSTVYSSIWYVPLCPVEYPNVSGLPSDSPVPSATFDMGCQRADIVCHPTMCRISRETSYNAIFRTHDNLKNERKLSLQQYYACSTWPTRCCSHSRDCDCYPNWKTTGNLRKNLRDREPTKPRSSKAVVRKKACKPVNSNNKTTHIPCLPTVFFYSSHMNRSKRATCSYPNPSILFIWYLHVLDTEDLTLGWCIIHFPLHGRYGDVHSGYSTP